MLARWIYSQGSSLFRSHILLNKPFVLIFAFSVVLALLSHPVSAQTSNGNSQYIKPSISTENEFFLHYILLLIENSDTSRINKTKINMNYSFFSFNDAIISNKINDEIVKFKDKKISKIMKNTFIENEKCYISEFDTTNDEKIIIAINDTEESSNEDSQICFLISLSFLLGFEEKEILGKTTKDLEKNILFGAIKK